MTLIPTLSSGPMMLSAIVPWPRMSAMALPSVSLMVFLETVADASSKVIPSAISLNIGSGVMFLTTLPSTTASLTELRLMPPPAQPLISLSRMMISPSV